MPLVVKEDESLDPADIGLFCPPAVVARAKRVSYSIQKLRLLHSPSVPRTLGKGKNFYRT